MGSIEPVRGERVVRGRVLKAHLTARDWLGAEWAPAARAAVAMVLPLALAVALGDLQAGLTMSLGAFAALYARREAYRRRALVVAAIGLGLVASAVLGSLAGGSPWTAGAAIAVVAAVATWVSQSSTLGPPGAYMFTLVAAVSSYLAVDLAGIPERAGLVAVGAAVAWLVVMAGVLVRPARPQVHALAATYDALAALLRAPEDARGSARHAAAVRLRVAADQIVAAGPRSRGAARLRALHGHARRAFRLAASRVGENSPEHAAAAEAIAAALRTRGTVDVPAGGGPLGDELAAAARTLSVDTVHEPAGEHFTSFSRWHLGGHSLAVPAALRVFVAALLATAVASVAGLPRAYWAPAAAVVVLQATSARLTLRRATHRVIGTIAGVLLAAGIFAADPGPIGVVTTVAVLQFVVEVFMARVYALGVAFVTPLALLIAEGAGRTGSLADLLAERLAETLIGCAIGMIVALVVLPRAASRRVPAATARVVHAERDLQGLLDSPVADEGAVEAARRALVRALTSLTEAVQNAKGELLPARYRNQAVLAAAGEAGDAGWLAVTRPSRAESSAEAAP